MNPLDLCPTRDAWQQWIMMDQHDDGASEGLRRHLDDCRKCQEVIETLSASDAFFQQSREALRSADRGQHGVFATTDVASLQETDSLTEYDECSPAILGVVKSLLGPCEEDGMIGRLGRFVVTGIIGSGGMGIVLRARSIDVDRIVAIKIPQPQYWQAEGTLLTLEREARSAAAVVHPNVIAIYHVDRYRDVPYLVMPYMAGESLEQRIRSKGQLDLPVVLRLLRQVASALAAAHACGVVHRDVKPANILLVGGTERAVLSDFGLAKVQTDATCTATGTFAGTPIYLSPEQAAGGETGPAADLFSLGTVLWTMLSGKPPLSGMHTHAIVHRIANGQFPPLPEQSPATPAWLTKLLERLHAKHPADRPTAEEVAAWVEQCERHLQSPNGHRLPAALSVMPFHKFATKHWIAVGLVAALAASVWMLFPKPNQNPNKTITTPGVSSSERQQTANLPPISNELSRSEPGRSENQISEPDSASKRWLDDFDDFVPSSLSEPSPLSDDQSVIEEIAQELSELHSIQFPRWESQIRDLQEKSP